MDNGEVIECTPEHRFMLRNGSYCEAQHLVSTEPLMTFDKNRISKKLYRWNSCYKKKNIVNHKVASVYIIDKEVDVYDITVEDNHNFALTAGVIVHNSKDTADAVCGAVWNASRNAEEFEYDFGETLDTVMTANADNGVSAQAQQLSIDFENEMRKMLDTTPIKTSDTGKPEPIKTTFTPSVIDGIILW